MLSTGNYMSNVASIFLRTVINNPSLLTILIKDVQTQRSIHSREQK